MIQARASDAVLDLRADLLAAISTHSEAVSLEEMIAICARVTGELLAHIGAGRLTAEQVTELTMGNIRIGVQAEVDRCAAKPRPRLI